jgi:eukaryotic-like serine/threonine-protein kinase
MPAKVMLTITHGPLTGQAFPFEEHTTRLLGRDADCDPRLPNDADHRSISRHHCLLEINPPAIRVRDFGSRNGTFVNGVLIGQRRPDQRPEDVDRSTFREIDLQDGDTLALDHTVFQVQIVLPRCCAGCGREPDEAEVHALTQTPSGTVWCAACRKLREQEKLPASPTPRRCVSCGETLPQVASAPHTRSVVCASCQADPRRLAQHLLMLAARAPQGQAALRSMIGYTLLRELGRGGMGAVYLAHHEGTGEQVALKVMLPKVAASERTIAAFLREAEATRALHHPHTVELYELGYAAGAFFFTLEYCPDGSLRDWLKRYGSPFPIDEACGYILQALDGLHHAHTVALQVRQMDGLMRSVTGLVHRDISPANLLLAGSSSAPVVKVGDFGIAKAFELAGLSGMTRTGDVMGKPFYMPRQAVVNFKYARPAVDVWAMAATLYELLTGTVPRDFPRGSEPFLVVLHQDTVPIRQRNSSIPRRLAEVIDRALQDKPEIGFQTAFAFKQALEEAL